MRVLIGLAALAGGAWGLRKYLRSRPIRFGFDGAFYIRQPDGSFTSEEGAPVISPQLEAVQEQWKRTRGRIRD